jgi:hypothetical protein
MTRSEALIAAQSRADLEQRVLWVRELGRGRWVTHADPTPYYNSTQTRVVPNAVPEPTCDV